MSYEDSNLVYEINKSVKAAFEEKGYREDGPGLYWVKRQVKNAPDQDWGDSEVKEENTRDIVGKALKWAKREGLKPFHNEEAPAPKELVATGMGQVYAAATAILPNVKTLRKQLWNKFDAPFTQSRNGFRQAVEWLQRIKEEDEASLGESRPGRITVTVTLIADDSERLLHDLSNLTSVTADLKSKANPDVVVLTSIMSKTDHTVISWRARGAYQGAFNRDCPFPTLTVTDLNGTRASIEVPENTRLANLFHNVSLLAGLSQWWSREEVLSFILFGSLPRPGVSVQYREPLGTMGVLASITLEVRSPTTKDEVLVAYSKTLEKHKLTPQTLSKTQEAVLKLVHETPQLSWRKRYRKWAEWRRDGQDLPAYGHNEQSGGPALYTEYKRAVERAGWGKIHSAKAASITAGAIGRSLSDDELEKRMKEIHDKLGAKRK